MGRMLLKNSNTKGFSLVELLAVVSIIGVLASMTIPQYARLSKKAHEVEAKTQLAALYSAEKAFNAEFLAYHSSFAAIGYSPEGNVRYNVGFGGRGTSATVANGYVTVLTETQKGYFNTLAYCKVGFLGGAAGASCNSIYNTGGILPPALHSSFSVSATSFIAGAITTVDTRIAQNTEAELPVYAGQPTLLRLMTSRSLNLFASQESYALPYNGGPQQQQGNSNPVFSVNILSINMNKQIRYATCPYQALQVTEMSGGGGRIATIVYPGQTAVMASGSIACSYSY